MKRKCISLVVSVVALGLFIGISCSNPVTPVPPNPLVGAWSRTKTADQYGERLAGPTTYYDTSWFNKDGTYKDVYVDNETVNQEVTTLNGTWTSTGTTVTITVPIWGTITNTYSISGTSLTIVEAGSSSGTADTTIYTFKKE